jgi:hypothetical protein
MDRVPRLKRDDVSPAEPLKLGPELPRGEAERSEIVVYRKVEPLDRASGIDRAGLSLKIRDARVRGIVGSMDETRLGREVGAPDVGDVQDGEQEAFLVPKRDVARGQLRLEISGEVEDDGNRPERPIAEPHLPADAVVIPPPEEAGERGEAAAEEKLEIAELTGSEGPRRPVVGRVTELFRPIVSNEALAKLASVRRDQLGTHQTFSFGRLKSPVG